MSENLFVIQEFRLMNLVSWPGWVQEEIWYLLLDIKVLGSANRVHVEYEVCHMIETGNKCCLLTPSFTYLVTHVQTNSCSKEIPYGISFWDLFSKLVVTQHFYFSLETDVMCSLNFTRGFNIYFIRQNVLSGGQMSESQDNNGPDRSEH